MATVEWDGDLLFLRDEAGGYARRMIAYVFPAEGKWVLRFYVGVNGQYRFGGFETEQDAKNVAIILWRVNNE